MKKNYLLLWGICLQFIPSSYLFAQLQNPGQWDTFVLNTELNKVLTDTILFQSFETTIRDTWHFQEKSNSLTRMVDASDYHVKNQFGNASLQLLPGSHIEFTLPGDIMYDSYFVTFFVAAAGVKQGTTLKIQSKLAKGGNYAYNLVADSDNYYLHFGQQFNTVHIVKDRIYINNNPLGIDIRVVSTGTEGSFFIDDILAYNNTRCYSLFKGVGSWEDKTGWSHYPAYRSCSALVKGDVKIGSEISCKELHVANGTVSLDPASRLTVNQLFLHDEIGFFPQGDMSITDRLHVYKTFPEKGKWYFVSFPADIYKGDIDSRFQLKDETPNQGGDFYYVSVYDGKLRSTTNSLDNWKVIPESFPDNIPLFEKGKGYLIALDEHAIDNRLLFSSLRGNAIHWNPDLFSFILDIPLKNDLVKNEHYGWVLCGNPFASPLPVKNIQQNSLLDGFLYYYDGTDYREIPLDSDQMLPPYAAFFLKSRSATTVKFAPPLSVTSGEQLPTRAVQKNPAEPSASSFGETTSDLYGKVRGNGLYLKNSVGAGTLLICDLSGRVVLHRPVPVGESMIPLPLGKGTYIYSIRAGKQQAQEKFVLY